MSRQSRALLLIFALPGALLAGDFPAKELADFQSILNSRKYSAQANEAILSSAKADYAAGASGQEIVQLLRQCPAKIDSDLLLSSFQEFKGLLEDGLLDSEARMVVLKDLRLRLKAGSSAKKPANDANTALNEKREEDLHNTDAAHQNLLEEVTGRDGQSNGLAQPTPIPRH